LIEKEHASLHSSPATLEYEGLARRAEQRVGRTSTVPAIERANDTTCVNVIDKDGNLFSATPSGAWLPALVAAILEY